MAEWRGVGVALIKIMVVIYSVLQWFVSVAGKTWLRGCGECRIIRKYNIPLFSIANMKLIITSGLKMVMKTSSLPFACTKYFYTTVLG